MVSRLTRKERSGYGSGAPGKPRPDLDKIRTAIARGEYCVSSTKLADKILAAGVFTPDRHG